MKVLVLEDDVDVGSEVIRSLRRAGFAADLAVSVADADVMVSVNEYDCFVFDRMLPDGDGLTLLERLRSTKNTTPALMLTARDAVTDRVAGFQHGADDYLVKPFAAVELVARVRALVRRSIDPAPTVYRAGSVTLDVARHAVDRDGVRLSLGRKEFAVLETLMRHHGTVVTRTHLIEHCWDELDDPASNVVDVAVSLLRRRLGPPDLIETVRGVGYRLL